MKELKSTLKAHFGEKDITSVYNDMTSCYQGNGEKDTALTFVVHMFALRDRILELSSQKKAHRQRYSPKLVQAEMQKAIYAGLRDSAIRQDLKLVLKQKKLTDKELMEELTAAMISKEEHEKKLEEATNAQKLLDAAKSKKSGKGATAASMVVMTDSDSDRPRPSSQGNKTAPSTKSKQNGRTTSGTGTPSMDPFMAQLANVISSRIQTAVEPLQAQITSLAEYQTDQKPLNNKQLNPNASAFQTPQKPNDGKQTMGQVGNVGGQVGNGGGQVSSGQVGVGVGNVASGGDWQQTLCKILENFSNSNKNNNNDNNRSSGGNRNNNWNRNNGNSFKKCSICRAANATSCNHCLTCHEVTHRTFHCPHKDDPNYTPKN